MQELYQHLSTDLQKSARRSDDRLSALITKAARTSGIAQRMLFTLIGKIVDVNYAKKTYDEAKEVTDKDLARPTNES